VTEQILVVGIGPGGKEYLLPIAWEKVAQAQVVVGGKRALDLLARADQETREIKGNLQGIIDFIRERKKEKKVAVLLSGDPGLYGMLNYLLKNFPPEELEVIPGLSSMQLCFARLKLPWQEIKIVSLHGRNREQLLAWVRQYPKVAFFTDEKFPPEEIGTFLREKGIKNKRIIVGENLSYPEERIVDTDLEGITSYNGFVNCVMLVLAGEEKPKEVGWNFTTPGIPDHYFLRGQVPMTKEEVRAATLSKARLTKDSIVYDLGAGTGSLAIEAAILASWGRVVAVERNPEGVALIKENCRRFGVENLEVLEGDAAVLLEELSLAHRIIIGGSGGSLKRILELSREKLLPGGRVVLNCIVLETLFTSLETLTQLGFQEIDISQISIAKGEKVGTGRMMKALNPIYIVAAEKGEN